MNKPTKPNITIPESFAANGVKADFDNNKILNGFDRLQPDVLAGDNLNKFIDDTYKASNYALNLGDYVDEKVSKSGDIMTGNLHIIKSGRPDIDFYNTNFDSTPTTKPSATTYCSALRSFDKDYRLVSQLTTYIDTGNNSNCAISAIRDVNGTNVSSTFTVMVKPDGTQTCNATGAVKQVIANWAYPSTTKISNPIPTTITKNGDHTYTAPCDGLFTFQYSTENAANAVKLYINNIMVYVTGDSQKSTHRMSGAIPVSKGMVIKLNTDTTNATGTNYFWKSNANV